MSTDNNLNDLINLSCCSGPLKQRTQLKSQAKTDKDDESIFLLLKAFQVKCDAIEYFHRQVQACELLYNQKHIDTSQVHFIQLRQRYKDGRLVHVPSRQGTRSRGEVCAKPKGLYCTTA